MIVKKNATTRIPLRLLNATGGAFTGADETDFASSQVTVVKADGTKVNVALVLNTNLFEIDDTLAPGLYHVSVPGANFGIEGPTQLAAMPSGGSFVGVVSSFEVQDFPNLIFDINDATFGKWEIKASGGDANRMILYRADGTTVLKKFDLSDVSGSPTFVDPFKRNPV